MDTLKDIGININIVNIFNKIEEKLYVLLKVKYYKIGFGLYIVCRINYIGKTCSVVNFNVNLLRLKVKY